MSGPHGLREGIDGQLPTWSRSAKCAVETSERAFQPQVHPAWTYGNRRNAKRGRGRARSREVDDARDAGGDQRTAEKEVGHEVQRLALVAQLVGLIDGE